MCQVSFCGMLSSRGLIAHSCLSSINNYIPSPRWVPSHLRNSFIPSLPCMWVWPYVWILTNRMWVKVIMPFLGHPCKRNVCVLPSLPFPSSHWSESKCDHRSQHSHLQAQKWSHMTETMRQLWSTCLCERKVKNFCLITRYRGSTSAIF